MNGSRVEEEELYCMERLRLKRIVGYHHEVEADVTHKA